MAKYRRIWSHWISCLRRRMKLFWWNNHNHTLTGEYEKFESISCHTFDRLGSLHFCFFVYLFLLFLHVTLLFQWWMSSYWGSDDKRQKAKKQFSSISLRLGQLLFCPNISPSKTITKRLKITYLRRCAKYLEASVTRLGDLLDFRQVFKAFGNN